LLLDVTATQQKTLDPMPSPSLTPAASSIPGLATSGPESRLLGFDRREIMQNLKGHRRFSKGRRVEDYMYVHVSVYGWLLRL
jgi:hypothetical protein